MTPGTDIQWRMIDVTPIQLPDQKGIAYPVSCELGEGPLWHALAGRLIWFDILGRRVFKLDAETGVIHEAQLPVMASCGAILDADSLVVAAEDGLYVLPLESGLLRRIGTLGAETNLTRSNDGRVDPSGRFWVGSMGRNLAPELGTLYRASASGDVEVIRRPISVANSIAFSPDGRFAYFADSPTRKIEVMDFDLQKGTIGPARLFAEIEGPGVPDGSVCDEAGCLWNAQWDGARIARYAPNGMIVESVGLPVRRPTCPAFGGDDLDNLFVTTAWEGLDQDEREANPLEGALLCLRPGVRGLREHVFRDCKSG